MIEGPIDNLYEDNEFEIEFIVFSDLYKAEDGSTYELRRRITKRYDDLPVNNIAVDGKRYTISKRRVFSVKTHMTLDEEITYSENYISGKVNL